MADVVLINPHGTKFVGDYTLPLGLLQSAVYINENYDVKLLDLRVKPNWRKSLQEELKKEPIFVGISTITGPNLVSTIEIAKFVKENSNALVVLGGIHATSLPEQTVKNKYVDVVIKGEGEESFNELAEAITKNKSLKGIQGVWYKKDGIVKANPDRPPLDLNKLPRIPFDILDDIEKYVWIGFDGVRVMSYMSSRGCPQQCTFCYITDFYKSKWKWFNADRVLDDFEFMVDRFKLGHIYINDDNFFVSLKRSGDIAQGLMDRKIDITWDVLGAHSGTVHKMDKEFVNLLDKSRCRGMLIGAESGSPRIHKLINKNITPQMIIDGNKKFIGTDIKPTYSFTSGYPTETREELQMTVNLLFKLWKDNKNIVPGNIKPLMPYPGTPMYDLALKYGFNAPKTMEGWADITWDNYMNLDFPWITQKDKRLRVDLYYATVLMNPDYMFVRNKMFKIASTIMSPLMKFRARNLNFKMPLEIKTARAIHHTAL